MATSAFKSTSKRPPIGNSSSDDSIRRAPRRSRSLSRFSRPIAPECKVAPKEKFVNTHERGSSFEDIRLDDLALEFFSSSSSLNNESERDGGKERKSRSRSVSRRGGEIGRWASDTASSSRRRERSVSRNRADAVSASSAVKNVVSSSSAAAGSRRRRSLSVARYHHISDSESEIDFSRSSSNRVNVKAPISANGQMSSVPKATTSSNRQLGRSRSHKNLHVLHDDYSSHSSALTDEEFKDTNIPKKGFEKIIRAVYALNKVEHPTEDVGNGGLYEEMRKELKYAVQEIRTEINQAIGRNHTALTSGGSFLSNNANAVRDFSGTRNGCATKLEQLEKHNLITERLLEDQRGREFSNNIRELHDSRTSVVAGKPSRARKKSTDRNRMSRRLTDEAERYFEDFISNVEDTDISSFDGERSDGSSTIGSMVKTRDYAIREAETYKNPAGISTSHPTETDGVALPWLQWDTSDDSFISGKNKAQTPVTPETLKWDSEKDIVLFQDPSSYSTSSYGSWTSDIFNSHTVRGGDTGKTTQVGNESSNFDTDEYVKIQKNEELLFEMYQERNRINLGGLLLCTGALY